MSPTCGRRSALARSATGAGRSAVSGTRSERMTAGGGLDPVGELLERQPALRGGVAQPLDRGLALGVGGADVGQLGRAPLDLGAFAVLVQRAVRAQAALDGVRAAAAALADHAHAVRAPQSPARPSTARRRRRPGAPAARSPPASPAARTGTRAARPSPSPTSAHRPGRPSAPSGRRCRSAAPARSPARAPGARCARARSDDFGVVPGVARRDQRARLAELQPVRPAARVHVPAQLFGASSSNQASAASTAKRATPGHPGEPAREVLRRGLRG